MILRDLYETELTERVHDIVYHATPLKSALKIVTSGEYHLSSTVGSGYEQSLQPSGYHYFLSTTRSKAGSYHAGGSYISSGMVLLKLDGNWFNRNYKSGPVDYWKSSEGGRSEQEDRVFSKTPTIPAKNILEAHVYVSENDSHKWDGPYLRKFLIASKKKNLPVWVYNNSKDWISQNKKNALDIEQIKKFAQGELRPHRTWSHRNYVAPWMELWHVNDSKQLSKRANKLKSDIIYTNFLRDWISGLGTDLSNERTPSSPGYHHSNRLIAILTKNRLSLTEFVKKIRFKWQLINIAEKNNVDLDTVKAAVKKGTQAEMDNARGNKENAEAYAINKLSYDLKQYDSYNSENITESADNAGSVLTDFLKFAVKYLKLPKLPKIKFEKKPSAEHPTTFGYFDPETDHIVIVLNKRHPMDIMRTLAHELIHYKQRLSNSLDNQSGETGSSHENEANAGAGVMMRAFGEQHAEYFQMNEEQVDEIEVIGQMHRGRLGNNQRADIQKLMNNPEYTIDEIKLPDSQGITLNVVFRPERSDLRVVITQEENMDEPILGEAILTDFGKYWQAGWVWVDERQAGKRLAAKMYKTLAKHYKKIIASDSAQSLGGKAIWTKSLPAIGVKVKLYLPSMGFSTGPTSLAYEEPTRYLLAIDPDDISDYIEEEQIEEIYLSQNPDSKIARNDLEPSKKRHYKKMIQDHAKDKFSLPDNPSITMYQVKDPYFKNILKFFGVKNKKIVIKFTMDKHTYKGHPLLAVTGYTWIFKALAGQNLAAKCYLEVAKRYNSMIVSDDTHYPAGAAIWTSGFPKLGVHPVPFSFDRGVIPGVDPYDPDLEGYDIRWMIDIHNYLGSKKKKLKNKESGPNAD